MSTVLRVTAGALLGLLLAGTCTVLAAVTVVPLALGWVPLSVPPASAVPGVPPGSQVVVEPLTGEAGVARLRPGDVVSSAPAAGGPGLVAHRVVAVARDGEGTLRVTVRGDSGRAADARPVPAGPLHGVVRYHVPWAGRVATLLDAEQKRAGTVLVAVALLGHAAWQAAARDRPSEHAHRSGRGRPLRDRHAAATMGGWHRPR